MLRAALGVLSILGLTSCSNQSSALSPGTSAQFTVGDVWTYQTRPGEDGSRVVIGRIDSVRGENVIHIKVTGVSIKNRHMAGGVQTELGHSPIAESALAKSVVSKVNDFKNLEGFQEGYDQWLSAFKAGEGGWFSISVAEILNTIEEAVVKTAS